jgi:hypothetical protein
MKAAGWTYKASGNGTTKDTTGIATNDLWGGSATPLTDTYPYTQLDGNSAWWCAEGPSTVKIAINVASSGTFVRGEIVTQAGSGATGELLGYVISSVGAGGWLSIMPQTGTFNNSGVVTGGTSGATVTATGYNLIRRQMVFAKDTTVQKGWIFYEALSDTEISASSNTALFSDLAANAAGCTATVAPGNSPAATGSNRFPIYGICEIGVVETSSGYFWGLGAGYTFGKAHMAAVNATPASNVSADGSFFCTYYISSQYNMIGLQRVDNSESGDLDPFIFVGGTGENVYYGPIGPAYGYTSGRTQGTTLGVSASWTNLFLATPVSGTGAKGYCARTTGTMGVGNDSYCGFCLSTTAGNAATNPAQALASLQIRNHPDYAGTPPKPIEMFSVQTPSVNIVMRKGICRWFGTIPIGALNDTADSKQWLVIFANSGTTNPAVIIGPMDGSTVPTTT